MEDLVAGKQVRLLLRGFVEHLRMGWGMGMSASGASALARFKLAPWKVGWHWGWS